jgi:hypothetical protein
MKTIITFALVCVTIILSQAQNSKLYVPREIKQAYKNGTRSYDGKPGDKYWQNTVDYSIQVEVIPEHREISGSEKVIFNNNSPDDLNLLVIRLYHDVFRKGNQRGMKVNESDINQGVEISKLTVAGKDINLNASTTRQGTNLIIKLPKSIASKSATTIEVDWKMVIPETTRRTGAYDSTSFFVSYWYPQIAVYDDLFGWDMLSYDFNTEFYNNLANFDVKIKAPKNFTVMATGVLQNAEEIFSADKLALYNQANTSKEAITIMSEGDATNGYSHLSGTWNYKASEVTDFSFCLSDHFVWDAAIQKVEDRNVLISTFYNVKVAERAAQLTGIQQKIMKHFSEDVPGIAYPYPEFTTCVMGVRGGGMETPMMANNSQPGRGVTIHEMMHTYFPMYVRINEKRFAWMDEGWANFNTSYVTQKYFQEDDSTLMIENSSRGVSGTLGTLSDLPLITSTQFMDKTNYGYASYQLPEFMYSVLHHHLGDELFRKCYKEYITSWAKKSPSPYDFFNTFERVSGQNLDWLWNPWFFNYGDVDLGIVSFDKGNLKLSKNGDRPIPVVVNVMYEDSTSWSSDHSAEIWKTQSEYALEIPKHKKVATIAVNKSLPDANDLDNYFPTISDRYGDFKIANNLLGEYSFNEYPITLLVEERNGLVYISTSSKRTKAYLLPIKDNVFEDLSGSIVLKFKKSEANSIDIQMIFRSQGTTLTGSKK